MGTPVLISHWGCFPNDYSSTDEKEQEYFFFLKKGTKGLVCGV